MANGLLNGSGGFFSGGRGDFCGGFCDGCGRFAGRSGAGDVRVQAKRVMQNLEAVLKAGGASFASVVKTTIYLQDLADFGAVNEVYGSFFIDTPPARATVQVAGLPKGALVEIDAIAVL